MLQKVLFFVHFAFHAINQKNIWMWAGFELRFVEQKVQMMTTRSRPPPRAIFFVFALFRMTLIWFEEDREQKSHVDVDFDQFLLQPPKANFSEARGRHSAPEDLFESFINT